MPTRYSRGQKIAIFLASCSTTRATAAAYLSASDWKLQQAIEHWHADQEDES